MSTNSSAVLVTGSEGLLGRSICRRLLEEHRVFGLDRDEVEGRESGAEPIRCDLTDETSVREAVGTLEEAGVTHLASVVHLAAYYDDFSGEPSPLYDELTVEGTRRLLRAVRDLGVDQFVLSSSILAMRPSPEGHLLRESSPELAEWDYPRSKLAAERVLRAERGDVPVVVLRIAGCYDEQCHSVPIAQQIRRIHERQLKSLFFPGNADHGQSFVHVEDVASCVHRVVTRRASLGEHEVFLVAEPTWLSYRDLQDRIGEHLHDREWATLRIPGPLAKAGAWFENKVGQDEAFIRPWMIDLADAHYPADIARARELLGWEPVHRLPDELPVMLDALRAEPTGWYRENGLPTGDEGADGAGEGSPQESAASSSRR